MREEGRERRGEEREGAFTNIIDATKVLIMKSVRASGDIEIADSYIPSRSRWGIDCMFAMVRILCCFLEVGCFVGRLAGCSRVVVVGRLRCTRK